MTARLARLFPFVFVLLWSTGFIGAAGEQLGGACGDRQPVRMGPLPAV
jgi:hypothetical protein